MLKPVFFAAVAAILGGCASFHASRESVAAAAPPSAQRESAPLQPVSLGAAPRLKGSQPVGLAPCRAGAFRAGACWRKGDNHFIFYDPAPEGLEANALPAPK